MLQLLYSLSAVGRAGLLIKKLNEYDRAGLLCEVLGYENAMY